MSSALSVRGLSAGYGPLQVLDGIDLDVAEQERVGLVGLNGHGKSTLMRPSSVSSTGARARSSRVAAIS